MKAMQINLHFSDTNTIKFSRNLEGGNFGIMVFGAIVCDLLRIWRDH